jgi:hypothetical protein
MATEITDTPIFTAIPTWDPNTVLSAETLADCGSFTLSADLSEWISTHDSRVVSALPKRIKAPMSLPFVRGKGKNWRKICSFTEENSIKRDMLMHGFALVEILYQRIDGKPYPRIVRQNARFLRYNKQERRYEFCSENNIWKPIRFDRGEWAILSTEDRDRPWQYGLWRALARWCLLTMYALNDCASYSERLGCGVWALSSNSREELRRQTITQLRNMGRKGVIGLGIDEKLALIESNAQSARIFFEQLELAHQEISIAIVGANLTSQASAGAGSVANVHQDQQIALWLTDNVAFAELIESDVYAQFEDRYGVDLSASIPLRNTKSLTNQQQQASARQSNSQALVPMLEKNIVTTDEAREILEVSDDN